MTDWNIVQKKNLVDQNKQTIIPLSLYFTIVPLTGSHATGRADMLVMTDWNIDQKECLAYQNKQKLNSLSILSQTHNTFS